MNQGDPQLWASQATAYEILREMGELFYFSDWASLPVKPRLNPLCVGASGVGKSFLVRNLAKSMGIPYLRVTPSSWLVIGSARENTPTLLRIKQFVTDNDRGLIHLDEIEKVSGGISGTGNSGSSDAWSRYLVGEVFDLLDRTPAPVKGHEWTSDLIHKLQHDFWFVATGTWQHLWRDVAKAKVGFGGQQDTTSIVAEVQRLVATTEVIPQELPPPNARSMTVAEGPKRS
jgi:ATP-dependent protease Clp ATPase subunit